VSKRLIIIPCYNEEKNLQKLIKEIKGLKNFEIVFINDNSTDNTEKILKENNLNYINHPINLGYNFAVQTGLKYGLKKGAETFILMDGDGQHLPSEIDKLLEKYKKGFDVIIGSRFLKGFKATYKIPLSRKLGMAFFSLFTTLITGNKVKDTSSGFQLFNRKVASFLVNLYETKYPDAEVIILLNLAKFKVKEIPVKMLERTEGNSMISGVQYPIRVIIGSFIGIIKYFFHYKKLLREVNGR